MAESHVQLNTNATAGAKAKTFRSTDGDGDVVETQAIAVTTPDGVPVEVATNAALEALQAALVGPVAEEYDVQSDVIYVGQAPRGSLTSAAVWTVKRTVLVNGNPTTARWAGPGVVWDARASAVYS